MKRSVVVAMLAAGLSLAGSGVARAEVPDAPDQSQAPLTLAATSRSSVSADPLCEQAREIDGVDGSCATSTTLSTSAARPVRASQISAADLALRSADGTTLAQAVAAGTVYYRTWHQEVHGLYYINWMEKHTGRYYYNGSQVWSTTKTLGYRGTHVCDQGYGVLYDIKVTNCSTDVLSSAEIQEWDYFQVHVVWKGIPLYVSHNMHATMTRSGGIS